jgi:hypothetical protein
VPAPLVRFVILLAGLAVVHSQRTASAEAADPYRPARAERGADEPLRHCAKLDLIIEPAPSVPRKFRIAFANRLAPRRAIARILACPAEKVVMAHGPPIDKDAQAYLRRSFAWLIA